MRNGYRFALAALAACLGSAPGQDGKPVTITLASRQGQVTPARQGCTHTGGGNIDVQQPSPDTVVVTMTGVAVAYGTFRGSTASMACELDQCFEVNFDNPKVKKAKFTLEGRVIGLLRSHCKGGSAGYEHACVTISSGPSPLASLTMPPRAVAEGENLSVNVREGPVTNPVLPGKFTLHQKFVVVAAAPKCLLPCKAPSAEFAPDALDPLWISYQEPFKGASKKDFGFQVTLKVAEDATSGDAEPEKKNGDKADPQKKLEK